ncbi:MAG: hypothetical protein JNM66_14065 [Bryobacterales bacterium]|nr:hypothetical protein [Bryobacterales bacterium]
MGKPLKFGLYLAVFAFTAMTAINFCGTIFHCGCQSMWSAGSEHCNIKHHAGPHCPWCTHGGIGFVVSMVPVFVAQAWAVFRTADWGWKTRLILALGAYPIVGGILGGIVGWLQGYWNH